MASSNGNTTGTTNFRMGRMGSMSAAGEIVNKAVDTSNLRSMRISDKRMQMLYDAVLKTVQSWPMEHKINVITQFGDYSKIRGVGSEDRINEICAETLIINMPAREVEEIYSKIIIKERELKKTINDINNERRKEIRQIRGISAAASEYSSDNVRKIGRHTTRKRDKLAKKIGRKLRVPKAARRGLPKLRKEVAEVLKDCYSNVEIMDIAEQLGLDISDGREYKVIKEEITDKVVMYVMVLLGDLKVTYSGGLNNREVLNSIVMYTSWSWITGDMESAANWKLLKEEAVRRKAEFKLRSKMDTGYENNWFKRNLTRSAQKRSGRKLNRFGKKMESRGDILGMESLGFQTDEKGLYSADDIKAYNEKLRNYAERLGLNVGKKQTGKEIKQMIYNTYGRGLIKKNKNASGIFDTLINSINREKDYITQNGVEVQFNEKGELLTQQITRANAVYLVGVASKIGNITPKVSSGFASGKKFFENKSYNKTGINEGHADPILSFVMSTNTLSLNRQDAIIEILKEFEHKVVGFNYGKKKSTGRLGAMHEALKGIDTGLKGIQESTSNIVKGLSIPITGAIGPFPAALSFPGMIKGGIEETLNKYADMASDMIADTFTYVSDNTKKFKFNKSTYNNIGEINKTLKDIRNSEKLVKPITAATGGFIKNSLNNSVITGDSIGSNIFKGGARPEIVRSNGDISVTPLNPVGRETKQSSISRLNSTERASAMSVGMASHVIKFHNKITDGEEITNSGEAIKVYSVKPGITDIVKLNNGNETSLINLISDIYTSINALVASTSLNTNLLSTIAAKPVGGVSVNNVAGGNPFSDGISSGMEKILGGD